jgi:DNA-binding transcriptional regulator YdaS (Cro superfamily)
MKPDEAIRWAGSQRELARACGVSESAVSQWVNSGLVPEGRAYQLEVLSAGTLKVDPALYRRNERAA